MLVTQNPQGWQRPSQAPWQGFGGIQQPGWRQPGAWAPPSQPGWGAPSQPGGYGAPSGYGPPAQLGSQPQYGSPGPFAPPPAPKRGGLGKVILLAGGFVLLAVVGLALMSFLSNTGSAPTAGGYVNESYKPPPPNLNPPPLPDVTTVSQAEDLITNNTFYGQAVPGPTRCQITAIDLTTASTTELETHMNDLVACLMRVWDGPVTAAGYQMPRPPVSVYTTAITTSCGKLPTKNAVYCRANQQIYYAKDLPAVLPASIRQSRFVVEMVVAHEFGHAIQARTGILVSFTGLENMAKTEPEANEMSRRGEMQADCFAGLFLRSVSQSAGMTQAELTNISALARAIGDDTLTGKPTIDAGHGLAQNRQYWTEMGLASTDVKVCNTFTAPSSSVR